MTPAYQLAVQAFLSAVLPRGTSGVPKSPRTASRALTCRASRSTQARRGGRGACAHVAATTFGFGTIHEHLRKTARANSWLGAFGHHRGKKSPGRLKTPCYFGPRRAVSAGTATKTAAMIQPPTPGGCGVGARKRGSNAQARLRCYVALRRANPGRRETPGIPTPGIPTLFSATHLV